MIDFLQFAFLGLGSAAIYALAGQGIVAIHQGSGVINFAHGAMALLAAELFVMFSVDRGLPVIVSIILSVAIVSAVGAGIYALVMRPLQGAAAVVRVVATLGVLAVIQQFVILVFSTDLRFIDSFLPKGRFELGRVALQRDRAALLAFACVMTVALHLLYTRTRFGWATRAAAENRRAASALGYSAATIGILNWAIGGALAGVAGILTLPISGLNVQSLVLLVLPGLAVSLVGGFRSFKVTLVAAIAIGVAQSLITRYVSAPGWSDALPVLVSVVVLASRGSAIPGRDTASQQLPRMGTGRPRPAVVAVATLLFLALVWFTNVSWSARIGATLVWATVALSLVVLMGCAGQISLGQFAFAGIGALVAGRLSSSQSWPFPLAFAGGVLAATLVGLLFALPALRTRGVSLAVITLGLAQAVQNVLFSNTKYTGGTSGTPVGKVSLFGWDIDNFLHSKRYTTVFGLVFIGLAVVTMNLRTGAIGRRMLAVRNNERAAAALGVRVAGVKFFAFGLAAAMAAIAGIFLGFRGSTVRYEEFDIFKSLNVVVFSLIGGIGFVHGAVVAGLMAPGTIISYLLHGNLEHYLVLGGGVLLVVTLILNPNGVADANIHTIKHLGHRLRKKQRVEDAPMNTLEVAVERVEPRVVTAEGVTVRYGGTTAVNALSLTLRPGRIMGLIGANGAGKTSFIDALSGFTPVSDGELRLEGESIGGWDAERRARAGISRTFQSLELFDDMTVRENLLIGTDRVRWSDWCVGMLRPREHVVPAAVQALIERLELGPWLDKRPSEVPFGLRRLLAVARAAGSRPSVLLVDEPAAGLNEIETEHLGSVLRWLADTWGMAILLVEHDVPLVVGISDDIVAMDFGQQIFAGTPSEAVADAAVQSAYLGTPVEVAPVEVG